MRRLIIPLAAAALVAACYDAPSTPSASLLTPRSPAALDGIPPPPPASGEGFGDFTAFEAADASQSDCSVHDTFTFAYEYFDSGTDNNAYLHIRVDGNGLDVAVHETTKKITANGTLTRPDFTFRINDVVDGTIFNKEPGVPDRVSLSLTGQLTLTDGTTCVANATLTAQLTKVDTTGDVLPPPQ
jgi:hypothetical protein